MYPAHLYPVPSISGSVSAKLTSQGSVFEELEPFMEVRPTRDELEHTQAPKYFQDSSKEAREILLHGAGL
jgi:hypothetical protein